MSKKTGRHKYKSKQKFQSKPEKLKQQHSKQELTYVALLTLFVIAVCSYGFYTYHKFYHDDAFISLRYCYNLINGHGLVWNPLEYVEGYTTFLFIIAISLLGRMGIDLVIASKILGIASYFGIVIFCFYFLKRFYSGKQSLYITYIPLVLVAASFPLIIWSFGGLETVFFALLCFISLSLFSETMYSNRTWGIIVGLCFSLTAMTRPEGVFLFLITCLFILVNLKQKRINSYIIWFGLTFISVYGIYFLWRFYYYGDLFPNTFYVKTGIDYFKFNLGQRYFWLFFFAPPFTGVMFLLTGIYCLKNRKTDPKLLYLLYCILIYTVYIVSVGGDHMPAFRFFIPLIPVSSLAIFYMLRFIIDDKNNVHLVMINAVIILFISMQIFLPSSEITRTKIMDPAAFVGSIVGKLIPKLFPEGSLIGLNTAGSTPYYAPKYRFIDMLGLNDRTIAKRKNVEKRVERQNKPGHEKGDGKYVLSRKPDYIIIGPAEGVLIDYPWFLSDLEISEDSSFCRDYVLEEFKINDITEIDGYQNYKRTETGSFVFTYYKRVSD